MSIASWHKKSSYDTFFHCIIGGLFFLLSVFTGLVQRSVSFFYCANIYKAADIIRLRNLYYTGTHPAKHILNAGSPCRGA